MEKKGERKRRGKGQLRCGRLERGENRSRRKKGKEKEMRNKALKAIKKKKEY